MWQVPSTACVGDLRVPVQVLEPKERLVTTKNTERTLWRDRFDSREDAPQWNETAFMAGHEARCSGIPKTDCPYSKEQHHAVISWHVGWTDADQGLYAEKEEKERHADACVAAIEAIGGNPETVKKMKEAIKGMLEIGVECKVGETKFCPTCKARKILAKIGDES